MSAASPGEDGGIDQDTLATGLNAIRRRTTQNLGAELEKIMKSEWAGKKRMRVDGGKNDRC